MKNQTSPSFVLVPDSFKGTMSSTEICAIMSRQILARYPRANITSIPVADGGEGSVDCFLQAVGGHKQTMIVKNPFFEDMTGFFGLLSDGCTAVVEMAACAGLPLVEERKNVLKATTYGVGQLLCQAAQTPGITRIIVGLGGSATHDGGCGAACAAGGIFQDDQGEAFIPTGESLHRIAHIDTTGLNPALKDKTIITMCDIDNPMLGPQGAAAVFGPQKGAAPDIVNILDNGTQNLAAVIEKDLGLTVAELPGSGAAGAMGAGMVAFFGSRLQMGIEAVLDVVGFEQAAQAADMILTGEGRIDSQSLRGKVVLGVARRAGPLGVPVVAVVGDIGTADDEGCDLSAAYDQGVTGIFSINRVAVDFPNIRWRAGADLAATVDNILRFWQAIRS